MPSIQNNLILIKGEDKTKSITTWRFEERKPVVWISFGTKEYHYNSADVKFYKNPVTKDVTPYRIQADALKATFAGTEVKADTVDKFQGQERSAMIFSTVDNEIGEFTANPNRLNVAVSRVINQFIVVTDGNDNDSSSPIYELIEYIKYHNHDVIDSRINSVFDYL